MKASAVVLLIYVLAVNGTQQANTVVPDVTHVATAVNHLTVLEFHEAVTMAAAVVPISRLSGSKTRCSSNL